MKCPTLERWSKIYYGDTPAYKLIKHWRKCKICKKNIKRGLELERIANGSK